MAELTTCYGFAWSNDFDEHYRRYYEYEKARGVVYGPEDLSNNDRYRVVADLVDRVPAGGVVLDYGCAHGHYTINLAKRYPDKRSVGDDLVASNIVAARAWAEQEGITNVSFYEAKLDDDGQWAGLRGVQQTPLDSLKFDCVLAAEILEQAGRRVEAINHHERALALDPELASSFRALLRLYAATSEHHKLVAFAHGLRPHPTPESAMTAADAMRTGSERVNRPAASKAPPSSSQTTE